MDLIGGRNFVRKWAVCGQAIEIHGFSHKLIKWDSITYIFC